MVIETIHFITIALVFLLAGTVKGIIGLGLPTVSLAILTIVFDLPTAMALLLVPSLITNAWQAAVGGMLSDLLRKHWLFFTCASGTVWMGGNMLILINTSLLSILLGLLLLIYACSGLAGFRVTIKSTHNTLWAILCGTSNGILTGMTGSFVVPGVMYLQALGLGRNALVQAMGILFSLSTIALGISLQNNNLLTTNHLGISLIALLPAFIGMLIGQRLRQKMSESLFRNLFLIAILVLACYIIINNLM